MEVTCSLVDQTPTPTRFLRSCEESGLFQELEEANPFDKDFNSKLVTSDKAPPKSPTSEPEGKGEGILPMWASIL